MADNLDLNKVANVYFRNVLKKIEFWQDFDTANEKVIFQKTTFYNGECHCSRQQPKKNELNFTPKNSKET